MHKLTIRKSTEGAVLAEEEATGRVGCQTILKLTRWVPSTHLSTSGRKSTPAHQTAPRNGLEHVTFTGRQL